MKLSQKVAVVFLGIFFCLHYCTSCALDDLKPSGEVTVVSSQAETSESAAGCIVTLKIRNTGSAKIYKTTINLSVESDSKTYYTTTSSSVGIPKDCYIFMQTTINFKDAKEVPIENSAKIDSAYYE